MMCAVPLTSGTMAAWGAELCGFDYAHRHRAAENSFDDDGRIERQFAPRVMQRRPGADAGAGGRAVDLTVREDTKVATVMSRLLRRPR